MIDPTGFHPLLNAARNNHGLGSLAWDQWLADAAAENNALQLEKGQGHWSNPNCWQCAFVGPTTPEDALTGFLAHGPHRMILLRGDLRRCGVACLNGSIWTVNLL